MKRKVLTSLLFSLILLAALTVHAQTRRIYSGGGFNIPDGSAAGASDNITVNDNYTLARVEIQLQITHTQVGDLTVKLSGPGGQVVLFDRPGHPELASGYNSNLNGFYAFDDDGRYGDFDIACKLSHNDNLIPNVLSGSYWPEEGLFKYTGTRSNGTWRVQIIDNRSGDTGQLLGWTLALTEGIDSGNGGLHDARDWQVLDDFVHFDAVLKSGIMMLQLAVDHTWGGTALHQFDVYLDTDQNPLQGSAYAGRVGGLEYRIEGLIQDRFVIYMNLVNQITGAVQSVRSLPGGTVQIAGNLLWVTVPTSALGNTHAVDVFAYSYDYGPSPISFGNGDRVPDSGVLATNLGQKTVRRHAVPVDFTLNDPRGDQDGVGVQDLASARFRTFDDQVELTLTFADAIDLSSSAYELSGEIIFDTDRNLLTGFRSMGGGIPTWGGDMRLSFSLSRLALSFKAQTSTLPLPPIDKWGEDFSDARWFVNGNQLIFTSSLSIFDPNYSPSNWGNKSRPLTDGRMRLSIHIYKGTSSGIGDLLPNDIFQVIDLDDGNTLLPYEWDSSRMISASDPLDVGKDAEDLLGIDAQVLDSNLVIRGALNSWDGTDYDNSFHIYLDTDMNAATGKVVVNPLTPGQPAIGAEYDVHMTSRYVRSSSTTPGIVVYVLNLIKPDGKVESHDAWWFQVRNGLNPSYFTVTIPFSALENLRTYTRLFMTAGRIKLGIDTPSDVAPGQPLVLATRETAPFTLAQPAAGTIWTIGSQHTLSWVGGDPLENVNLKLSTDGGATFPVMLHNNIVNNGSANITVPNQPTTRARVRVEAVNSPGLFANSPGDFTIKCSHNGDVDNNGTLTPGDAQCAFSIFLNNHALPASCDKPDFECEVLAADVNCDGAVTAGDALEIFKRSLQNLLPQDCFARLPTQLARTAKKPYQLSAEAMNLLGPEKELLKFTLRVNNPEGLQAFGVHLNYTAEKLELLEVRRANLTSTWLQFQGRALTPGKVIIGGYDSNPTIKIKAGELCEVIFAVKDRPIVPEDLSITRFMDDLASTSLQHPAMQLAISAATPSSFRLSSGYPNPFRDDREMIMRFDLPGTESIAVELVVYNITGQLVRRLFSGKRAPGNYEMSWDGRDEQGQPVPSGIYVCMLKAGKQVASTKVTKLQ